MGKRRRDPVASNADRSTDLYEIADWEVRSRLDRFAHWLYHTGLWALRGLVILAAVGILVLQVAFGSLGALGVQPLFAGLAALSAVPALLLAAYIWYADVTTAEPLTLLVGTFLLGVLFAGFAGLLNVVLGGPVQAIGSGFGLFQPAGTFFFFFLVVGPVEESVKLLAVRLYAYRDDRFDAVIDGAVYGAAAGLGFATIENALYIVQNTDVVTGTLAAFDAGSDIAAVRALAGPGHVIYSAFAGYYLGLAKFNPEDAGPIVLKGLLIATVIHATYNSLSGVATGVLSLVFGVDQLVAFFAFVLVYDGVFGLLLLRKLDAYRQAYQTANAAPGETTDDPERTDFEP
ncbi:MULTISPECIES: PrsW family intramembrane metalloprotease [Haloarcula]|uniref:PrsW family intramembrane metalloprotease n=1 Tax=Haloarcula pellucida TaxID=1427151 RepID=A0A830GPU4_9EURY|nr:MULTISPECIES: PrsW family glutamic-type intramembrane protease [Halomicroarcula]MBX0348975.1 PrsW family intramembrane metalloprotease [Halomicroarcula pellucida]MDS0279445.1 PrsW family glutamic-type intramembrane protease [Halomicroarcula sp. S1AR25-4]GGN98429.1 PrsW family intramembrane metalloprotease [Halomicroarcula pellucida]